MTNYSLGPHKYEKKNVPKRYTCLDFVKTFMVAMTTCNANLKNGGVPTKSNLSWLLLTIAN